MDGTSGEAPGLETIIVGVDGSTASHRALAWAAARSRDGGAEVVAVHVLTYSKEFNIDFSLRGLTNWRRQLEHDLAGPWTEPARAAGARVRAVVVEDETTDAGLLAAARHEDADLVVLGAHRPGSLADRLLGATTYQVAHRAKTPVVIIPPEWTPDPAS